MTPARDISLAPPVDMAPRADRRERYPRYPLVLIVSAAAGVAVAGLQVIGALALIRLIG